MTNVFKILAFTLALVVVSTDLVQAQLLVSDRGTNQISQYDQVTGEFLGVLVGGDPATNGGLLAPSAMTIGPNNELFVASQQTGGVLRYDLESGDFLGVFAEQVNGPAGLLFDAAEDELLVSTLGNFDSELVLRYRASTGELLSAIGEGTGETGRTSMTFGPDGNLYVSSFADAQFFLGSVLQFSGESHATGGLFAGLFPAGPEDPFHGGASGLTFHEGTEEGTYQLDVVGLFSNNVARFGVATTEDGLQVQSSEVLIASDLDFPSAIQALGDGTMLVTNLGNDNPMTGDLRSGSIGRFDVASGEFLGTFIAADANLSQPTALLLLNDPPELDCDGNGMLDASDLDCACFNSGTDGRDALLAELGLVEADLNMNGEVDFADFLILSENFGEAGSYTTGDIDCSGAVDFSDFLRLSANFGNTAAAVSAVPEPNSILMLSIGGSILLLAIRRRN